MSSPFAKSEAPVVSTALSTILAFEVAPANSARGAVTFYVDDTAVFDDCAVVEF